MEIVKAPFKKIALSYLGRIFRPYVLVFLTSTKTDEWFPAEMVVDSGADYTLLPKRYAFYLGVDLEKDCKAETTLGVGGSETIYLYKEGITVKIGKWQKKIPVGFLERDDVPPLLGRLECLEVLKVTFDKKKTIFED
jgi:predicted aspartyl protease